jgi:hypothetical protein
MILNLAYKSKADQAQTVDTHPGIMFKLITTTDYIISGHLTQTRTEEAVCRKSP